jgi:di/tricarboxylate transporter
MSNHSNDGYFVRYVIEISLLTCFSNRNFFTVGFSNEALITIGTLFLVVGAVERSHAVDYLARKAFGQEGSDFWGKFRLYFVCFGLSIFFNNTPLVAILLPVVKDWGRMRGIGASQLLMPLSFSVLSGSFISMIGTSTNLTVQALMQADRGYSFPFFAPAPIGGPLAMMLIIYMLFAGPCILPMNKSGLIRAVKEQAEQLLAEVYVSPSSIFINRPLSEMMSSLGLAPSLALKIRRKVNRDEAPKTAAVDSDTSVSTGSGSKNFIRALSTRVQTLMVNLQDPEYLRRVSGFWTHEQLRQRGNVNRESQLGRGESAVSSLSAGSKGEYEMTNLKTAPTKENGIANEGEYIDIIAPTFHETILPGDVVFIAHAQDVVEKMMKSIAGESQGLCVLESNALDLPGYGTELVECIISDSNPFVGRVVSSITQEFNERYQAGLITVRGKDWGNSQPADGEENSQIPLVNSSAESKHVDDVEANQVEVVLADQTSGNVALSHRVPTEDDANLPTAQPPIDDSKSTDERELRIASSNVKKAVSEHVLHYGDVVLCVTSKKQVDELYRNRDFFVVSTVGNLPLPMTWYSFFPVLVFTTMLILAATETLDICPGALMAASFFFIGGWIKADDIPKLVDIRLLMLIGTSLSFARAMTASGLAETIAQSINDSNPSSFGALLLIYAVTLVITEFISNNAAAALMYPIASALATELGCDFKPFAMGVLVASTAGFMSPIGYQTHVMVWAPGGYNFWNFVVFGFLPDLVYWIIGCVLIIGVYPF